MANYPRRGMKPEHFHTLVALVMTLILSAWLYLRILPGGGAYSLLAGWLLGISVVTFGYFGFDKWRARQGASRVPEVVLHGLTLLGGSLAAYAAMKTFRHKTIKGSFQTTFWIAVGFQAAMVVFLVYWLYVR